MAKKQESDRPETKGLVPVVMKLRAIAWDWTRASMERTALALGLTDRTTGSETWVGYRSPDPEFPTPDPDYPGEFLEYPYGFSLRGEGIMQFQLSLAAVDMGEVCLYESDKYNEVCEQKHAEFRATFKKTAKQISTVLGKPVFQGGPDDAGIRAAHPLGYGCELAAVWRLPNARVILEYGQEDKELPIVLDLFVLPPSE